MRKSKVFFVGKFHYECDERDSSITDIIDVNDKYDIVLKTCQEFSIPKHVWNPAIYIEYWKDGKELKSDFIKDE